jgi:hypothetical protein
MEVIISIYSLHKAMAEQIDIASQNNGTTFDQEHIRNTPSIHTYNRSLDIFF